MSFFKFKRSGLTKEKLIAINLVKGLAIGIIITAGVIVYFKAYKIPKVIKTTKAEYESLNNQKYETITYVSKDIPQGTKITKDFLVEKKVPADLIPEELKENKKVDFKDKLARVKIPSNTPLISSLLVKSEDFVTNDLRNQDFSHIILNENLEVSNYVDIRYKRKDGSDFVVAAKKKVLITNGNILITNITEIERKYINNASVEASLTDGMLYTTIYVDPENQTPAKITYELNDNIAKMIEDNPNIVIDAQEKLRNNNINTNKNLETDTNTSTDIKTKSDEDDKNKKPQFVGGTN
ncbi:hypothetical protein U732_44 [Clostridium argentinense CDC 2741]|uniref:SAF-like family protein n=2 Tax=Clostridium argentinense TaxID=29341 RepID=A0A0C1TZV5_9CLOT|nr:hypothetical protein [Clostridium argentinense]ARC83101.1 hypothetical protein RSJ17_00160 [Clostridium argentinense]KIE44808.1 hypothetical protein U732_44 [Clostridium argentinense CDC 2741]NFF41347.1 hypothetical protein [Clostridium argentinense]NFP51758.1 hypothetical protein [Clostridium argentinense]NFP74272.1 hypothetical protein [Clostridium argentinense]